MYTKKYISGTEVELYDGNDFVYTLIFDVFDNSLHLYDNEGNEIVNEKNENKLRYINVNLLRNSDKGLKDILNTDVVTSCYVGDYINGDVTFVYTNYRFNDGSRQDVYFCVINDSFYDFKYNVKLKYTLNKSYTINYKISPQFNTINESYKNYLLVPDFDHVNLKVCNSTDLDFYCNVCLSQGVITDDVVEENVLSRFQKNLDDFNDYFRCSNSGDLYCCYDYLSDESSESDIIDSFSKLKSVEFYENYIKFDHNNFINGKVLVYERETKNNKVNYKYRGTCFISKCFPKIVTDVVIHNENDKDYVVNGRRNETDNLIVLRDVSGVSDNVYLVPQYDVNVSSYISNDMIGEGYIFGRTNIIVGDCEGSIDIESYGDYTSGSNDEYQYHIETFKLNGDNMEQDKQFYNKLSATNELAHIDTNYINIRKGDYLDYSAHDINITEDNRIIYC